MSSRRGIGAMAAVLLVLVAILALSGPRQDTYRLGPLDPNGTGPEGLAATVALLRSVDARVRLGGLPDEDDDVVFQPRDTLSGAAARTLARWVSDGGTLVVTDEFAALAAPSARGFGPAQSTAGTCTIDALAGVERVEGLGRTFAVGPRMSSCFGDGDTAGIVVSRRGDGLVISISSFAPFINQGIDEADDAALAVALLAPRFGTGVRVLDADQYFSDEEVGDGTILGALPDRGRQALLQVVVAFVAWGLVRGRRLGKVVPEELPVNVPGSDLVLAVGELLGRGDDLAAVADRLRRRSRRELGVALGLGADPDPQLLLAALGPHVSLDPAALRTALVDPVPDVDALLDVSHRLDRLREELHDRHAPA